MKIKESTVIAISEILGTTIDVLTFIGVGLLIGITLGLVTADAQVFPSTYVVEVPATGDPQAQQVADLTAAQAALAGTLDGAETFCPARVFTLDVSFDPTAAGDLISLQSEFGVTYTLGVPTPPEFPSVAFVRFDTGEVFTDLASAEASVAASIGVPGAGACQTPALSRITFDPADPTQVGIAIVQVTAVLGAPPPPVAREQAQLTECTAFCESLWSSGGEIGAAAAAGFGLPRCEGTSCDCFSLGETTSAIVQSGLRLDEALVARARQEGIHPSCVLPERFEAIGGLARYPDGFVLVGPSSKSPSGTEVSP